MIHGITRFTMGRRALWAGALVAALTAAVTSIAAQRDATATGDCTRPLPEPITVITLPRGMRDVEPTRDGCWAFVAFVRVDAAGRTGIGVYRRVGDAFEETRFVEVPSTPNPNPSSVFGLALTHDQKVLVASHFQQVTFFDVDKLTSGDRDPVLGQVRGPRFGYSFGVAITPDDRYAFVAQGATSLVAVIDLMKGRASGFDDSALVSVVPTTYRPSVPAVSPDGQYLYFATKLPPDVLTPSLSCLNGKQAEGALQIVDVPRATSDGPSATVDFAFPAGCEPTVVTVSPDGNRLLAVAAGDGFSEATPPADSSLVVFDVRPVREGKPPTLIGKVPMPKAPNSVVDTGDWIIVGGVGAASRKLTVVDPSKLPSGAGAIVGTISVAATNLRLRPGSRTLFGAKLGPLAPGLGLKALPDPGPPGLLIVDLDRVKVDPIP